MSEKGTSVVSGAFGLVDQQMRGNVKRPRNGAVVPLMRLRVAFCTECILEADVSAERRLNV